MAKRRPPLPDFHLWHEVAGSVSPLERTRRRLKQLDHETLPLPSVAPPPKARKLVPSRPMPSYRSDGKPGRGPGTGIEPNLKKRLQRGTTDIDGTIDLHGMRQAEAHAALSRFIHARVSRGDRTILVITGKGLKKLGHDAATIVEAGVLRTMLPVWLSDPKLSPLIAGWDVAAQSHGGEGAYYVRLRRTPALVR
jgi:DNA-nicking Smr family endonuclease